MFGGLWHSANLIRKSLPFRSYESGYKATDFGFRPNPCYVRTSHIRNMLSEIVDGWGIVHEKEKTQELNIKINYLTYGSD